MERYLCRRTPHRLKIDGNFGKPEWLAAPAITQFWIPPAGTVPQPATSATAARLLHDDSCLYFAADMEDSDIYSSHTGHDPEFGGDDMIELFIKPHRHLPCYWEFHIMPGGATRDYFYARRYAGDDARWIAYNSGMQAEVQLRGTLNNWEDRDQGWSAEMAVPWEAFARMGGRPQPGDVWTFMVARYDYSVYLEAGLELSACVPLPEVNFHLFEHYMEMVFE